MKCPKCKKNMKVVRSEKGIEVNINLDVGEDEDVKEKTKSVKTKICHCDKCNVDYASHEDDTPYILSRPKLHPSLIAAQEREAEQLEALREYNRVKQAEKDAEKEARTREALQQITSVKTGNIKSYTIKEINDQLELGTDIKTLGAVKKPAKKKVEATRVSSKKALTEEEKKEKQREYHRKRYAALKAKKNQ